MRCASTGQAFQRGHPENRNRGAGVAGSERQGCPLAWPPGDAEAGEPPRAVLPGSAPRRPRGPGAPATRGERSGRLGWRGDREPDAHLVLRRAARALGHAQRIPKATREGPERPPSTFAASHKDGREAGSIVHLLRRSWPLTSSAFRLPAPRHHPIWPHLAPPRPPPRAPVAPRPLVESHVEIVLQVCPFRAFT